MPDDLEPRAVLFHEFFHRDAVVAHNRWMAECYA